MKTLSEIRTDLKHIRLYHRYRQKISHPSKIIVIPNLKNSLKIYANTIKTARKPLQRTYDGLYIRVLTQKALALEWGVTEKYIQILNKRLILLFQNVVD